MQIDEKSSTIAGKGMDEIHLHIMDLAQATCPYITKSFKRYWAHTPDTVGLDEMPI